MYKHIMRNEGLLAPRQGNGKALQALVRALAPEDLNLLSLKQGFQIISRTYNLYTQLWGVHEERNIL